ncbi:hypothetical protein ACE4RR_19835 [Alteribacillus sp. HJP-4]
MSLMFFCRLWLMDHTVNLQLIWMHWQVIEAPSLEESRTFLKNENQVKNDFH